jgi:hypothetical protein
MKMLAAVASVVVLYGAVVTQSKADAIYKWHGDPASPNTTAMSLTLVVSEDAVKAGHVDFTYYGLNAPGTRALSTDVKELAWSYSGPTFGAGFAFQYERQEAIPTAINVHLNLSPFGYAIGVINTATAFGDVAMALPSDASGLFSMDYVASGDRSITSSECRSDPKCVALPSGTIRRVGDVPEPGTFAMLSLGLVALARFARRKV